MIISLNRLITKTTELCKVCQRQVWQTLPIHPWLCEGQILGAEADDLGASGERENLCSSELDVYKKKSTTVNIFRTRPTLLVSSNVLLMVRRCCFYEHPWHTELKHLEKVGRNSCQFSSTLIVLLCPHIVSSFSAAISQQMMILIWDSD